MRAFKRPVQPQLCLPRLQHLCTRLLPTLRSPIPLREGSGIYELASAVTIPSSHSTSHQGFSLKDDCARASYVTFSAWCTLWCRFLELDTFFLPKLTTKQSNTNIELIWRRKKRTCTSLVHTFHSWSHRPGYTLTCCESNHFTRLSVSLQLSFLYLPLWNKL